MSYKKKRKVWKKINLMETSAVGIPAYPDAHLSHIPRYEKVMTNASLAGDSELNEEKQPMTEEQSPEVSEEVTEEVEEVAEAPAKEEATQEEATEAEEKSEETEESVESEAKSFTVTDVKSVVAEEIKRALENFEVKRGLVEKQAETQKLLKEADVGALFLASRDLI